MLNAQLGEFENEYNLPLSNLIRRLKRGATRCHFKVDERRLTIGSDETVVDMIKRKSTDSLQLNLYEIKYVCIYHYCIILVMNYSANVGELRCNVYCLLI